MSWVITAKDLGWSPDLQEAAAPYASRGFCIARILRDHKISYTCLAFDEAGFHEREVVLSGRMRHQSRQRALAPAVGDWVAVDLRVQPAVMHACLPRRNTLRRQSSGPAMRQQILVANVDQVAVVTDAGVDFNLERLRRFLEMVQVSGAAALVIVNKMDLGDETHLQGLRDQLAELLPLADVIFTNARRGRGLGELRKRIHAGQTLAFVGSSGVGKSTLINRLIGERWQHTEEVNPKTGRGRHTTTHRELVLLKRGGMVVDNPGIKEVEAAAPDLIPASHGQPATGRKPRQTKMRNLQDRRDQEAEIHPNRRH
jgi:ribosome biogenesis GTPase